MLIKSLPPSIIECATQILKNTKHPIAYVSFRDVEPSTDSHYINEELSGDIMGWVNEQENDYVALNHLRNHQSTDDDKTHIYRYTSASRPFNRFLYDSHKNSQNPTHFTIHGSQNFTHDIRGLDAAVNRNKLEMPLTTYSGIGWHPHSRMDDEGIVHLPAYTSTTTSKSIAHNFAVSNKHKQDALHILRIKNHIGDSGVYTKDDPVVTSYEGEKEFIIPRNTKLKINKSPTTFIDKDKGIPVHVWDAERIHSDPVDTNYKTPHGNTELYNKDGLKLYQTDTLSALREHYPDFHRIDCGSSFHESHVIKPVYHLHTPDGMQYQGVARNEGESHRFLAAKSGKFYTVDGVMNKYPQLNKFRNLFDNK